MRSVYFSEKELECPCCGKVDMNPEFLSMLDNMRVIFGSPMIVNSGFRCRVQNGLVGGELNSSHMVGRAVDIRCRASTTRFRMVDALRAAGFRRYGTGKGFIHVDNDPYKPQDVNWTY